MYSVDDSKSCCLSVSIYRWNIFEESSALSWLLSPQVQTSKSIDKKERTSSLTRLSTTTTKKKKKKKEKIALTCQEH